MAFGLDDLIAEGIKLVNKFVPDANQRAQAESELRNLLVQSDIAQSQVNAAEAASGDKFVTRGRPFIIWVCGVAFAMQYIFYPLAMWGGALAGYPLPKPPTFDHGVWELMFGMLGMGAMRSFDKMNGK